MKSAESAQLKALLLGTTIKIIPSSGTAGSTTVFDGYLSTLLLAGMQRNNTPEIDRLLDVAIHTFEGNGVDGSTILVHTLVNGDFLSYPNTTEECSAECTRPLTQHLVNQKTQLSNTSLIVDPDPDDLEPSVSDSYLSFCTNAPGLLPFLLVAGAAHCSFNSHHHFIGTHECRSKRRVVSCPNRLSPYSPLGVF